MAMYHTIVLFLNQTPYFYNIQYVSSKYDTGAFQ